MKREFYIYKEGVTSETVAINSRVGEPFDRDAKIKKYLMLGYHVYDFDWTEIFEIK